jgi:energy-coupling factor transporter ATP-binding protein EcfA2
LIKLDEKDDLTIGNFKKDLIDSPALFRSEMSGALGIGDYTSKLRHILIREGYVLTVDFGTKLLFLNERRKVGANTILQGESGCGKSELVRVFSEIINLNFDVVPDKEGILHKIFVFLLDVDFQTVNKKDEKFQQFSSDFFDKTQIILSDVCRPEERLELVKWLKAKFGEGKTYLDNFDEEIYSKKSKLNEFLDEQRIESLFKTLHKIDQISKDLKDYSFLTLFAKILFKLIDKTIYHQYPLFEKSEFIKGMIEFSQQNDFQIQKVSQIYNFINEMYCSRPKNLYFKILMHAGISIQSIKSKIRHIIQSHQEVNTKYKNGNISTVVFVDEMNTCSYPGLMKEIFGDKSIDGEKNSRQHLFHWSNQSFHNQ